MGYSEQEEKRMAASAEKAFSEMPEDQKPAAAAMRSALMEWLVRMDTISKDIESAFNDEKAEKVFQHAVSNAVAAMHAEEKPMEELVKTGEFARRVVCGIMRTYFSNARLVSRSSSSALWEQTGFHFDSGIKVAFAKAGNTPYKPIGFDDGQLYVGTEGSKLLWRRQFALAFLTPFEAPFAVDTVQETEKVEADVHAAIALTDKDRERFQEVVGWFESDLSEFNKLYSDGKTPDEATLKSLETKMRDSVDLARVRVPLLDSKLKGIYEANNELGEKLEGVNITQLVAACLDFLKMKLEDDGVRRQVSATQLSVRGDTRKALLDTVSRSISMYISGDNVVDGDALASAIARAQVSMPELAEVVSENRGGTLLQTAKALLECIEKQQKGT